MEVNPDTLLFTQDSIKNTFKQPREDERIDDAVDSLLEGSLEASDFPMLNIVSHEGRLWSLDNRRLWVFKKAEVPSILVNLVSYYENPRFGELIECNHVLKNRILQPGYWPRVRGRCRQVFHPSVPRDHFFHPVPVQVKHKQVRKLDTVSIFTPDTCTYNDDYEVAWPALGTGFRDAVLNIRHDAPYGQNQATSNHPAASFYTSSRQNGAKEQTTASPIYASYGQNREKEQTSVKVFSGSYGQNKAEEPPSVSPIYTSYGQDIEKEQTSVKLTSGSYGQNKAEEHPSVSPINTSCGQDREKERTIASLIPGSYGQNKAEEHPFVRPIYTSYGQDREKERTIAGLISGSCRQNRADEHRTVSPAYSSDSYWQDRAKELDKPQCRVL